MVNDKNEATEIFTHEELKALLEKYEIYNLSRTIQIYKGRNARFFIKINDKITESLLNSKIENIEKETVEENKVIIKVSKGTHFLTEKSPSFFSFTGMRIIQLLKSNHLIHEDMDMNAICIVKTETRYKAKKVGEGLTEDGIIDEEILINIFLADEQSNELIHRLSKIY